MIWHQNVPPDPCTVVWSVTRKHEPCLMQRFIRQQRSAFVGIEGDEIERIGVLKHRWQSRGPARKAAVHGVSVVRWSDIARLNLHADRAAWLHVDILNLPRSN